MTLNTKDFEALKALGADEIAAKTHIIRHNVDALLNKSFDQFGKVQFNGFVSILEREFRIDLSSYKDEYRAFHSEKKNEMPSEEPFVIRSMGNQKKRFMIPGLLAVAIATVIIAVFISTEGRSKAPIEINNTAIDKAKETLATASTASSEPGSEAYEVESVQDQKLLEQEENITEVSAEAVTHEDVVLIPRVKIWMGIINMQTHKRRVEMTKERVRLDASKEWLIVTGHGRLRIEQGEEEWVYKKRDQMLFMIENGIFQPIDQAEFRARNRGKIW